MRKERKKGVVWSAAFHLLLFILLVAGLPSLFEPRHETEPTVLTVDILPISSITNVKPSDNTQAAKKEEPKKPETKKPAPPVKTADNTPPPPPKKEEKEKKPEKKVEKKAEEKKPEKKPEKKMKEEDLLAVLKAVKETANKESAKNTKEASDVSKKTNTSQQYNPDLPLSLSEKDAIKNQIAKCWSVPAGAKDAQTLVIWLEVKYEKDGSLIDVTIADQSKSRYDSDTFFRAAADSAKRAVRMCAPLKGLPADKYAGPNGWGDIIMDFDPKDMLN